jgi:predicted GNAT superfamily acetyltransferase
MSLPIRTGPPTPAATAEAAAAAVAAAVRSGVRVAVLDSVSQLSAAADLINQTWPAEVSVSTLRALRKVGNYVGGAYRDGRLVGACVAFFGSAGSGDLHSHLAVVAPAERSSGIGWALKVSQRAWAMEHGVARIQWTYDPLEARNAYVNLAKLSARPVEYLDNFYGDHGDGTESVFPTDRLLVSWDLGSAPAVEAARGDGIPADRTLSRLPAATVLARGADGAPREGRDHGEPVALIAAPEDATGMRARDPSLALEWRMLLRDHLGQAMRSGAETIGFTRDGFYVIRRRNA